MFEEKIKFSFYFIQHFSIDRLKQLDGIFDLMKRVDQEFDLSNSDYYQE